MSKRRPRKQHRAPRRRRSRPPRRSMQALETALERADGLIARGQAQAAIELLGPLLVSYPHAPDLHYTLGYAQVQAGDVREGLAGYERAVELSDDPGYCLPLGVLYLEVDLRAHALRALRRALEQPDADPMMDQVHRTVAMLEQDIADMAHDLELKPQEMEEGLYQVEVGQRALDRNDYQATIAANRRAIQVLGDWPVPHNNLALALFYDGQPREAIGASRQVLARHPDNVYALSNAIRFLAWTGGEPDARALWERLKDITPQSPRDHFKIIEAAAVLDEDESVYRLLSSPGEPAGMHKMPPRFASKAQLFLAVAEANTGRHRARGRLRELQDDVPWAGQLLAALKAGKAGPGWAGRFPYFHSSELVPRAEMEVFVELIAGQQDPAERRFREQVGRFVDRFPQITRVAEKLIWEEEATDLGTPILAAVATPAAHAVLRRYALSQVGEDDARMQALSALIQSGGIARDEWVRLWLKGAWEKVQVREYEIIKERESAYSEEVADLLNRALAVLREGDEKQAERLYRQVLRLDRRAKEAYNNLGTIYQGRGDRAQAWEMFEAALEVDPNYVIPRCNLANYLVDEGDLDGAEAMLKPLGDLIQFRPEEMTFYAYAQARILVRRGEHDKARQVLEAALHFTPDYEPAKGLLEWIEMAGRLRAGFESLVEQQCARYRATRARLQAKLSTPDPALSEALPLYTKDALVGMGHVVLPWGGWSALRKAELVDEIVTGLQDGDNLRRIVAELSDDERTALRRVLASGGTMPWHEFDAEYGNDLDESPYWNHHTPKTTMGRLRRRGLLVETSVDGGLLIAILVDLRRDLGEILAARKE